MESVTVQTLTRRTEGGVAEGGLAGIMQMAEGTWQRAALLFNGSINPLETYATLLLCILSSHRN
ncbi:MAG: hypothetical protein LBU07_05925 [Coriobacteriales bacterium]|jgi:hypothetical protein|nr:hypothetical protein [Coriobacteriales bacterium]